MAKGTSDIRTVLPCPVCGRGLFPAPPDFTLNFLCKSGHKTPIVELLSTQSALVKGGLETLLAEWERQRLSLVQTVDDARQHGFHDVAEIFHRHAQSLESRIEKVREAFTKTESSKRIPVPESLRGARSAN